MRLTGLTTVNLASNSALNRRAKTGGGTVASGFASQHDLIALATYFPAVHLKRHKDQTKARKATKTKNLQETSEEEEVGLQVSFEFSA